MEKRERKPGYFARLKRRRQLKQSQSEKAMAEQNPSDSSSKTPVISCPDLPAFSDPGERIKSNPTEGLVQDALHGEVARDIIERR